MGSMVACEPRTKENVDQETSPGVTHGGTGVGTTATGVGTTGTPGGIRDIGDTIRVKDAENNRNR
jgi:hypothetical protein